MAASKRTQARHDNHQEPCSLQQRAAGVLLHLTSLPGPHGSGDLGVGARRFADFLQAARQRWWQMLPTGPVGAGNSPYSANSAFAGGEHLIDVEDLVARGWLQKSDLPTHPAGERVDFDRTLPARRQVLRKAFARLQAGRRGNAALDRFCKRERRWLDDYTLFAALKEAHGERAWTTWDKALVRREASALRAARRAQRDEIAYHTFVQWVFAEQWQAFRAYCTERGIGLVGDMPIFVTHDSADVWANQRLYQLDRAGNPRVVSGVPPDYFSKTGQLWGHPLYRWSAHRKEGFAWWVARFASLFSQYDAVRIDHFLGFHRLWNVKADAKTAQHGKWTRTPGDEIFAAVARRLGHPAIIAEDLGELIPQAAALRDRWGFPGMRVIQFAFDGARRYDQPHRYPRNAVAYTGTHDNTTTKAWFEQLPRKRVFNKRSPRERALAYSNGKVATIHWDLLRVLYASPANTVVAPLQDLLGLGARARMNKPGVARGNWGWRATAGMLSKALASRLQQLAITFERDGSWRGDRESEIS